MNGAPKSSIASGHKFSQMMVHQTPKYDCCKMFRRQLKRGRPASKQARQYWIK